MKGRCMRGYTEGFPGQGGLREGGDGVGGGTKPRCMSDCMVVSSVEETLDNSANKGLHAGERIS